MWRHLDKICPNSVAIAGYYRQEMLAALAWCRLRRRVAIVLSESKADDTARFGLKERAKALIVRRYNAAVVGGQPQRRYLEELGFPSAGVFTGYDVVDNASYHPDRTSRLPLPIERPYFLMVNRFVPKKNLSFALECYAEYRRRMGGGRELDVGGQGKELWDLVLAGDGPLMSDLRNLVSDLRLTDFVHLPGFLQQDELLPYLAHCGAFIHASTVEQWGLVVNEAMAAGRAVFVSRRCGCFEDLIIEGKTGMGFDPTNRQELINLMLRATRAELPLDELGEAALIHIGKYSPLVFGNALKSAYNYSAAHLWGKS